MKKGKFPKLQWLVNMGLASYDDIFCPDCQTSNVSVKVIQDEPKFSCQNKKCLAEWYKNTGSGTYDSALDHAW
jgi:hypothetical protein